MKYEQYIQSRFQVDNGSQMIVIWYNKNNTKLLHTVTCDTYKRSIVILTF